MKSREDIVTRVAAKTRDLTRDLGAVVRLGTSMEVVNRLLIEALDALGSIIPFDLATVMELSGEELVVRVASGPLDGPAVRRHRLSLASFPSIRALLDEGHARAFVEHDHRDGDGDPFDGLLDLPHGHACMVVPLRVEETRLGVITVDRQVCGAYPPEVVDLADVFGRLLALAMSYGEQSQHLERLSERLTEQNRVLREKVHGSRLAGDNITALPSAAMQHAARLAQQVAAADTPVLVTGETGTGKGVLAHAIHEWSPRAAESMISINCASLPAGLIESELFGHVKGAFTGARANRIGRFQAAHGGTLLLDEVGELPLDLQAKLLRVLQDGSFEPVGSDRTVHVDVRVIAATNVDLLDACAKRRFREDLYYRLAVFPIHLAPLRTRREDIGVIAERVLADLAEKSGRGPWQLTRRNIADLEAREWRGNVRELVNVLERATILSTDGKLDFDGGPARAASRVSRGPARVEAPPVMTLAEAERRNIERALAATGGKVYGPGGAAELLDVNASTLVSRMKKLGLGTARSHQPR